MKKKRKSETALATDRENLTDVEALRPCAADADADYTIAAGQALHFSGSAQLQIKQGAAWIAGRTLTPESGPVSIHSDVKVGGPLAIQAANAGVQSPYAGNSSVVVKLSSQQRAPAQASSEQQPPSFEVEHSRPAADAATSTAAPQPQQPPQEWLHAAANLSSVETLAPQVAIVGSKQTGKSSFARLLVNSLLNKHPVVAYLESDCGQTEFTPPGLVSLVFVQQLITGPPHMHPQQPVRAHFVGDVSPQMDPARYVHSITSLLTWFETHVAGQKQSGVGQSAPPLVINTHGWIKGTGLDMLTEVLRAAQLTHLVQMQSGNAKRNLPHDTSLLAAGDDAYHFQHMLLPAIDALESNNSQLAALMSPGQQQRQGSKGLSPVDTRALSWLAFARGCLDDGLLATSQPQSWDAAACAATAWALAKQPPFATPWATLGLQVMHCAVPHSELPAAVNGTVVGLAVSDLARPVHSDTLTAAPAAEPLSCLGLGIVRTLDVEAGTLYLLTPLSEDQLQRVDTLQMGRLQLPPALLQAPGLQSPYLALFSLTSDNSGSRSMKSRGNLLRAMHM